MGYAKRRSSLATKRKSSTRGRSQSCPKRGKTIAGYDRWAYCERRKPKATRKKTAELIREYWGSFEAYRAAVRKTARRDREEG